MSASPIEYAAPHGVLPGNGPLTSSPSVAVAGCFDARKTVPVRNGFGHVHVRRLSRGFDACIMAQGRPADHASTRNQSDSDRIEVRDAR